MNLKILNGNYNLSDYGRYGYSTESFYSNIYLVKWPIFIQLLGAIICLSCSSTYHLFTAYSTKCVEILSRLDYAGISILIAGSCYPAYYYFYYCNHCKSASFIYVSLPIIVLVLYKRICIDCIPIQFDS